MNNRFIHCEFILTNLTEEPVPVHAEEQVINMDI